MIGTGLTPEGINQNYVIYDLMIEMGWRKRPVDLANWFVEYSRRRYGQKNKDTDQAWTVMKVIIHTPLFITLFYSLLLRFCRIQCTSSITWQGFTGST